MTQLSPYLKFDGNCREAMTFYQKCLGGELSLQAVEETPMTAQMPAEAQKKILHATLTHGGIVLMASDMVGPEGLVHGSTIFLSLDCGSKEEIKTFFSKLSAGGQVTYPLKTEFWGATFGQVIDKYGMTWLLNYTQNPPE